MPPRDGDDGISRTASETAEVFRLLRLQDELRRVSEASTAEEPLLADEWHAIDRVNRRTSSVSLPIDGDLRRAREGGPLNLRARGGATPAEPSGGVGTNPLYLLHSRNGSVSDSTFANILSKVEDDRKSRECRSPLHKLCAYLGINRFGSGGGASSKAARISPLFASGGLGRRLLCAIESGREPEGSPSKRGAKPSVLGRAVLILACLACLSMLSSLVLHPVPAINSHGDPARSDAPAIAGPPIQLPWVAPGNAPRTDALGKAWPAEGMCPRARAAARNATVFERQFGAHAFHDVHIPSSDALPRKRRVALFTGAYSHIRDGVSLTLNKMVAFLEANGHEVLVFAPTNPTPAIRSVGKLLSVDSMPIPGRSDYRLSLSLNSNLQDKLNAFDPDVVHIATPDVLGFEALIWAKMQAKPTACSYHTRFNSYLKYYNFGFIEPLSWLLWGTFYGHCDHVYVPSKEISEELAAHGISSERIRPWARGVDTDLFSPAFRCPSWREALGIAEGEVTVLLVCRLVWEKNLELFAKAIEGLQSEGIKFKSVVVGEGPAREALQRRLKHTTFVGNLKGADLSTAYASSDVYLFPSTTETFGSTTLEAMASGLPVVVADASGSSTLVRNGRNGFVASAKDVGAFVAHLRALVTQPDLRRRMGGEGERMAREQFQYDRIFTELVEHYDALQSSWTYRNPSHA